MDRCERGIDGALCETDGETVGFHQRCGFTVESLGEKYPGVERIYAGGELEGTNEMSELARTPEPPYYAVIFTSVRTPGDNGYADMAGEMTELAKLQPGFLGIESARGVDGVGITVSYWDSEDSIREWKENGRHRVAQKLG